MTFIIAALRWKSLTYLEIKLLPKRRYVSARLEDLSL